MVIYLLTQCRKVRQDNQLQGLCPAYLPYKNNIYEKDVDFFNIFFINFLQCFCLFVCLFK